MSGTATIATVVVIIAASTTLGVAHQQGWGAFGEFEQTIVTAQSCKPQVLTIGWSTGSGARALAETRALVNWSKKAGRHGPDYASWHNARARDVTCLALPRRGAKCTTKARPCQQKAQVELDVLF